MGKKAVWPLVVVAVLVLAAGAYLLGKQLGRSDEPCDVMAERVDDLDSFRDVEGVSEYGSEWISVMTTGVTNADSESRTALAKAVKGDADGYERFRSSLPAKVRPRADRLHALILVPDSERGDPSVQRDADVVWSYSQRTCGFA